MYGLVKHRIEISINKIKVLSAMAVQILTLGQLSRQNQTQSVDDFLKSIIGKMTPSVMWYYGTQCESAKSLVTGSLKTRGSEWSCQMATAPSGEQDALDIRATFKLVNGNATSAAMTVSFDFDQWSEKNYLFVPTSIYNGNRYRAIGNGYNPEYPKDMYYNPDVPLTISNNPRLSIGKVGMRSHFGSDCMLSQPIPFPNCSKNF